jgi:hypothetical protein
MTIARLRSQFNDPKSRSSTLFVARCRDALIALVRRLAEGVLISGLATASRLMCGLHWQTDSAMAAIVVVGRVVCLELVTGAP